MYIYTQIYTYMKLLCKLYQLVYLYICICAGKSFDYLTPYCQQDVLFREHERRPRSRGDGKGQKARSEEQRKEHRRK